MAELKRYGPWLIRGGVEFKEEENGIWVKYTDHLSVLKELEEWAKEQKKPAVDYNGVEYYPECECMNELLAKLSEPKGE